MSPLIDYFWECWSGAWCAIVEDFLLQWERNRFISQLLRRADKSSIQTNHSSTNMIFGPIFSTAKKVSIIRHQTALGHSQKSAKISNNIFSFSLAL
jgi:hypothetical protein